MRLRESQNTTPYRNREQVAGHKKEQNTMSGKLDRRNEVRFIA